MKTILILAAIVVCGCQGDSKSETNNFCSLYAPVYLSSTEFSQRIEEGEDLQPVAEVDTGSTVMIEAMQCVEWEEDNDTTSTIITAEADIDAGGVVK